MVAVPPALSPGEAGPLGRAKGRGGSGGGALGGAGPGAGLSLLVKRQPRSRRRRERGAACPPAGPGADPGAAGKGVPRSGLGPGEGRRGDRPRVPGCKHGSLNRRGKLGYLGSRAMRLRH